MRYTTWNKKTLFDQMTRLIQMREKKDDIEIDIQISMLSNLIRETISLFPIEEDFTSQLELDILTIDTYSDFINDIKYFQELKPIFKSGKIYAPGIQNISNAEILSFIHDFYNHLDKDLASCFNRIFKERKNNLKFSQNRSYNIFLSDLKYSYINIEKQNTVEDYLNGVHEYAHSVSDLLKYRNNYNTKYPFLELLPIFMELVASDELNKIYLGFEEDITMVKAAWLDTTLNYAKSIIMEAKYLSQISIIKNKKDTIKEFAKFSGINKKQVENIFEKAIIERYAYVIPFLTAIELYYMYKLDPEYTLYVLKKIIMMEEVENYNDYLTNNKIILNDNSKKYVLAINNELKKR